MGRALVPLLTEAGEEAVAVSRQPQPAGLPAGVRHARADVGNAASMGPVLDGADAFFILLGGGLNGHGESPKALLDTAEAAGPSESYCCPPGPTPPAPIALPHARLRECEAAVHTSGADFTLLRPGGFASNAFARASRSAPGAPSSPRPRKWHCPSSTLRTSPRSPLPDCARTATRAVRTS
ncbi:SDR family oxidoreductase [Streptomyces avidinii]|uniref:SDR family oxidoreductase n=1 Tax=Streptomyces avidinii TaxID=1895 RepID=UPI0037953630